MNQNLGSQQIERLLNDLELDESEKETIFPEILSDLSDAEYEVSVHDT